MASRKYQPPHATLGKYLKTMRQKLQETLGETSGAVEIDVAVLDKIERGEQLPSEDILLLLINHFGLHDDEAVELWELAGYDAGQPQFHDFHGHSSHSAHGAEQLPPNSQVSRQAPVMMLAFDNRVLYSNNAEIISDDAGVTINFEQTMDPSQPPVPVSRVGMSYNQAEKVLSTLQRVLLQRKYLGHQKMLGVSDVPDPDSPDDPPSQTPLPPRPAPGKPDDPRQS